MDSVGYFYNLHVNVESFLYCITSVKKYSPGSTILLFTDESLEQWEQYEKLAKILSLPLIIRDTPASYISRLDDISTNLPKIQEFIHRMYTAATMLDTTWMVRLEDDVHMRREIREFPTTMCAGNYGEFGLGGASIMHRETFIKIYENYGPEWIEYKCLRDHKNAWAGDMMLREMFEANGYPYAKWIEITEDWMEDHKDAAFHHGDKRLYNKTYLKQRGLI